MAASTVTNVVLTRGTASTFPTGVTEAVGEGALVDYTKNDGKILLILKNAITNATHTAVINKGNGLQGVANLEVTIAASTTKGIVIESGSYKNVSGTNKGKILVQNKNTTVAAFEVSAVVLP